MGTPERGQTGALEENSARFAGVGAPFARPNHPMGWMETAEQLTRVILTPAQGGGTLRAMVVVPAGRAPRLFSLSNRQFHVCERAARRFVCLRDSVLRI
jgi:hypothetical protein